MINFRTDRNNSNAAATNIRWKVLVILNLILVILCTIVFGITAFVVRADAAITDNQNTQVSVSEDWYELSKDGRILNIHLDDSAQNHKWKYGLSNNIIRESDENGPNDNNDYTFNMNFIADSFVSGDTVITLQYVENQASISKDTRVLPLHVENGKFILK